MFYSPAMSSATVPPSVQAFAAVFSGRLAAAVMGLLGAIGRHFHNPKLLGHTVAIQTRLVALSRRLRHLLAELAAGRLPPTPAPRPGRSGGAPPKPLGFPATKGWFAYAIGWE